MRLLYKDFTKTTLLILLLFQISQVGASSNTGANSYRIPERMPIAYEALPDTNKKPRAFLEKIKKLKPANVQFSGYYRFNLFYRNVSETYPDFQDAAPQTISLFDGYFDPVLSLNVAANPTRNTTIFTDFLFFTPNTGRIDDNIFLNWVFLNLYGTIETDAGTFGIRTGGIHWENLSPFTLGSNDINLNRYTIFNRNPWESAGNSFTRYDNHYQSGDINLDNRFIDRAFKGLILEGSGLPQDFSFKFLYGKSQLNVNDGQTLSSAVPNYSIGGKVSKTFSGKNRLGLNSLNSFSFLDSVQADSRTSNTFTVSHLWYIKDIIRLEGETGLGAFSSPTYDREWSPAINFNLSVLKKYTYIPLDFQFFYVGENFVNQLGAVGNTSIPEASLFGSVTGQQNLIVQPFFSPLSNIGFLNNNRYGFSFNTEIPVRKMRISFGYSLASEIERLFNEISVNYRVNTLTLSRLYQFDQSPGPNGPYERFFTFFRGAYNVVTINTDSIAMDTRPKRFSSIELQLRYNIKLANRDLFVIYNGGLHSSQPELAAIPLPGDDIWVWQQYHELEIYYQLFPAFMLTLYGGYESIQAGLETQVDAMTGLPSFQEDWRLGIGFDLDIAKNTSIFIRQVWFDHKDNNYALDQFKGREGTVEIKVFF